MYFPDRGCVHTLLTLYVYATVTFYCVVVSRRMLKYREYGILRTFCLVELIGL